jgi:hypothetical protein
LGADKTHIVVPPDPVSAENLIHVIDQAVFVDQATGASVPSDAVLLKVDRFG